MLNVTGGEHYTFETIGSTYRFVFPYRKEWLLIVSYGVGFVFVAIFFWPIAGQAGFGNILGPMNWLEWAIGAFVLLMLGLMVIELLWQLMGKEVVEISDDAVVIAHRILGLGPSKRFAVDKVNGVFVSPRGSWAAMRGGRSDYRFFNFKRGHVGLNSGKNLLGQPVTYRFGSSLEEGEAGQIVAQILSRFPQYKVADALPHP